MHALVGALNGVPASSIVGYVVRHALRRATPDRPAQAGRAVRVHETRIVRKSKRLNTTAIGSWGRVSARTDQCARTLRVARSGILDVAWFAHCLSIGEAGRGHTKAMGISVAPAGRAALRVRHTLSGVGQGVGVLAVLFSRAAADGSAHLEAEQVVITHSSFPARGSAGAVVLLADTVAPARISLIFAVVVRAARAAAPRVPASTETVALFASAAMLPTAHVQPLIAWSDFLAHVRALQVSGRPAAP
mmetsp:Transcript_13361/g.14980  ORF Transcript_13361/g.14980 Transcript_13361/m.14980 type:complete len:247 (+) Transcript_13361:653-1393(+)